MDSDRSSLASLELIPDTDSLNSSTDENSNDISEKPQGLISRIRQNFCFNQTVTIEHPFPASLQLLTNFYRCVSFSFSGCLFVQQTNQVKPIDAPEIDERSFSLWNWKYSQAAKRILLLCINIFTLSLYVLPFLNVWETKVDDHQLDDKNGTLSSNETQEVDEMESMMATFMSGNRTVNGKAFKIEFFSQFVYNIARGNQNSDEVANLKPILRLIMQWLVWVYMLNGFLTYLLNIFLGGAFLRQVISIREFSQVDQNRSFAMKSIIAVVGSVVGIKCAVLWMYQKEMISEILWPNVTAEGGAEFAYMKQKILAVNLAFEMLISVMQNVVLLMTGIWFAYTMFMFRRCIELMQKSVIDASDLDELQLSLLKTRLLRLNSAFKTTINFFAPSVTFDLLANTYMLIGSACFLIINQDRGMHSYTIAFIANIGLFALVRLVGVASVGNSATNAAHALTRVVYEVKGEWNLQEWLCYLEIKRMPQEFEVSIFSVYSVQQSSILTMLGFALNYIVILLQTENYGSSSAHNNATVININDSIGNETIKVN